MAIKNLDFDKSEFFNTFIQFNIFEIFELYLVNQNEPQKNKSQLFKKPNKKQLENNKEISILILEIIILSLNWVPK